ncbi:uncharacterized protein [Physcomitrium patens]|nr:melanotransferrin-like isoform X2 [Physcomitrium patens]XP_024364164.1 melanotransferrin-like isoform X2 [Physcomitrium patens]XP_024364165.1 melanotransferrin-like isoform X2 [Physcomitrium patens]XP_024364166.1 melanotransferrin-like isoform X2 [Physcomitrium patens]XP_024364167.1 melanotransferrin-like isoform X2 [Physcomitrium patens]XP_024364169.1 melanotransferrin-like isoform X2 [Physcomitrium patens]XP_024364170.1 melanotransferrin-like isoform X2 [Physcomitrium patens]XP_02436417|eukprot:XP_024364163.1 melanotransferrin-like isoform X2 [Physcomitrella patens]
MKRINAGTAPHQYHPVGIVKKASCPGKLADMKGKRSCLSRYGRSVGWTVPIATMIDANLISTVSRTPQINDIELVMAFFSKKCAALNAPKTIIRSGCTTKDEYYDYQGAFKGVIEGACDVGFMKFTIPAEYALDGIKAQNWTGLERPTSKALLCSSGPAVRGDLSSFATCNFGSLAGNLSRKISLECLQPHNRTSARRIQIMGWQANGGLWLVVRGAGLYVSEGTGSMNLQPLLPLSNS